MDESQITDYIKDNTNPKCTCDRSSGWVRTQERSVMIPAPEPGVNDPPRSKSQSKSKQTTVAQPYIRHAKPGMMCTDDVRVMSSKSTHHHRPWAWEALCGKQGTLITKCRQGPEHINLKFLNSRLWAAGSMWHSPPGSPAQPCDNCFIKNRTVHGLTYKNSQIDQITHYVR